MWLLNCGNVGSAIKFREERDQQIHGGLSRDREPGGNVNKQQNERQPIQVGKQHELESKMDMSTIY